MSQHIVGYSLKYQGGYTAIDMGIWLTLVGYSLKYQGGYTLCEVNW